MDAEERLRPGQSIELRASRLSREFVLRRKGARLTLEQDGSVVSVASQTEGRLLFGAESVDLHKVQAGIKIRAPKPDWKLAVSPYSATYSGRVFESIDVIQQVEFCDLQSTGIQRRVRLTNSGGSPVRVLLTTLHDPTAAHFRPGSDRWGSLSLNGFNRTSHVAMDEVAEPPSARIIGSQPAPKAIFMTTERARAEEFEQSAEEPESTAGMSGQILIVTLHEIDLPPRTTRELVVVSLYNPFGLEEALSDFRRAFDSRGSVRERPFVESSSESLNCALRWMGPSLEGAELEKDLLERLECIPGLTFTDRDAARLLIDSTFSMVRGDGFLPHSTAFGVPGRLETALFVAGASFFALLSGDRKYQKLVYRSLRKPLGAVFKQSPEAESSTPNGIPEGWRRRLGKGCPEGMIPEVVLATASALSAAAALATLAGKPEDSVRFVERAELSLDSLRRSALGDTGTLALYIDRSGVVHREDTIDQAVALYRHPFDRKLASAVVHRLQESDFETGFGPRTVPTSNRLYFNGSYGDGQLGGFWTRASLAAAMLAYAGGFPGLGSLQLQKIGRLISDEAAHLGGVPGSFPLWLDPEGKTLHGSGSDPVSASRLFEAMLRGELGVSIGTRGLHMSPPVSSALSWLMVSGVWLGEDLSAFVGRSEGRVYSFARCTKAQLDAGTKFAGFESIQSGGGDISACLFHGPGQIVCAGNRSTRVSRSTLRFGPKDPAMLNHLSLGVEELNPSNGSWSKVQVARVSASMSLDVTIEPGGWKALRFRTD